MKNVMILAAAIALIPMQDASARAFLQCEGEVGIGVAYDGRQWHSAPTRIRRPFTLVMSGGTLELPWVLDALGVPRSTDLASSVHCINAGVTISCIAPHGASLTFNRSTLHGGLALIGAMGLLNPTMHDASIVERFFCFPA